MVLIVHVATTAHVVPRIVLNDLLVFRPIVVRLALHEAVRRLVNVVFLSLLQLGFLFLGRKATNC